MDISDWRRKIDAVDAALLELLNQRAQYVLEIGEIKRQQALAVYDPGRERSILQRLEELNRGPLSREAVQRLFERIIDESRHLEKDVVVRQRGG